MNDEIIVDNFAGGGGASTGIEMAGLRVHIAINHDREAVEMHRANHPETFHYCEDVWNVDPLRATRGRKVGLAWFSPDCKHFSKAKGGKPVSKNIRGLAWVVIKWAKEVRPRVIMLENVEEFETWGPLLENDMPCPERRGLTFRRWKKQLENCGYKVEMKVLRACDYGAPTIRKRLFIIARNDGQPIVWPRPTHGDPKSDAVQSGALPAWRTAAECIDWSLPCPSIFERIRPLANATLRRIARGIQRYVIDSANPFIVNLTHQGGDRIESLADPFRTVTAARRGEKALVAPVLTEHANASSPRCMPVNEPLRTICAQTKGGHHAIIAPTLIDAAHGEESPSGVKRWGTGARDILNPLPTVTASGGNSALVAPTLVQIGYGERDGQQPRAPGLDKPLGTVVAGGIKHALVSGFLAKHYGGVVGTRVDAPAGTITTSDHHSVVAAHITKFRKGSTGSALDDPLHTVTAGGEQARPGTGNAMGIVASNLIKLKGTCKDGQPVTAPLHTVAAGGMHYGEVRTFLMKYYGSGSQDSSLHDPMHTVRAKECMSLVTIEGQQYVIADIGMRMLAPRELYRAQGFPDSYIIAPEFDYPVNRKNGTGGRRRLSKSTQVRMCGNSVCPPLAAALVRANFAAEIAASQQAA